MANFPVMVAANNYNGTFASAVDYTADVESVQIILPVTTNLPTATVKFDNQSGKYTKAFPLFSQLIITPPQSVYGTMYFYIEKMTNDIPQISPGGGINQGRTLTVEATAAPELLYLTEGNLNVVGTDIAVPEFGSTTTYVPYTSTYPVGSLGIALQDIGLLFYALLTTTQPNHVTGYSGRLGYDATGLGINTTYGVQPAWTGGGGALGLYVANQWSVGLGATGAQKSGLDIIKDVCTNNIIDSTGTPQYIDWYVNPTNPPALSVFKRGSNSSGTTFVMGTDAIQSLSLPVDTTNVDNFIIYWTGGGTNGGSETNYPLPPDAWSNYDTNGHFQGQWSNNHTGGGAVTLATDTNTPYSVGFSNKYSAPVATAAATSSKFPLGVNGYGWLQPARNLTKLTFWLYSNSTLNLVSWQFQDSTAAKTASSGNVGVTNVNTWELHTLNIPADINGYGGGFSYATTTIATIVANVSLTSTTPAAFLNIDYITLYDNWGFSPVVSWNTSGPTVTQLTNSPSSGSSVTLDVNSSAGYSVGQFIVVGYGAGDQEPASTIDQNCPQITALAPQAITVGTLFNNHTAGETVIGLTHDPNSIAAYGTRIDNYVDFYVTNPGGDTAEFTAINILNQRKKKSSSGTITLSGYNQGLSNILPGYTFQLTAPKDVYVGNATVDSSISGWIVDSIQIDILPVQIGGFTVSYTVEPLYSSNFNGASPDNNFNNLWHKRAGNPATQITALNKTVKYLGQQKP